MLFELFSQIFGVKESIFGVQHFFGTNAQTRKNFAKMKEKTSLWSVLKGDLPTRSTFAFKGSVLGVGGSKM